MSKCCPGARTRPGRIAVFVVASFAPGKKYTEEYMKLRMVMAAVAACFAMLVGSSVRAHIPFIEAEAREADPASLSAEQRAEMDYSFENPFPHQEDIDFQNEPGNTFQYDGIDSMAVNGYLVPGEVDVFRLVPAENDSGALPFPGAVLASALPPACGELVDQFPLVALVGPGLPREADVLDQLPFDIDDASEVPQPEAGMNGALFAPNPTIDPREVFVEDVVTGLSWFLPAGTTQECLEGQGPAGNPFQDCETLENSIVAVTSPTQPYDLMLGETYYVAIWDPDGEAQDYTIALGITDAHYVNRPNINSEIECFQLLHDTCTAPYPDMPEGYFTGFCEEKGQNPAPFPSSSSSGCSVGPVGDCMTPVAAAAFLLAVLVLRRRARRTA